MALKSGTVASIKGAIEELLSSAESVRGEEVSRRELIDTLTGQIKSVDSELKSLNSELAGIKNRSNELNLATTEIDLKLKHLKEGIIERYGVDIEAIEENEDGSSVTGESVAESPEEGSGESIEFDIEALETRRRELRERI